MSKRLSTLIIAGALSITCLTGCQSTNTEIENTTTTKVEQQSNNQEYFKQVQFRISEELNNINPNSIANLQSIREEVVNLEVSEEEQPVKDLLLDYLDSAIEYVSVQSEDYYRTHVYHLEGSYINTVNSSSYPEIQVVEPIQPEQSSEPAMCPHGCGLYDYQCGSSCIQPAEVELSDETTHCDNCHSTNIEVVDNTGAYICNDCDYWN